MEFPTDQAGRKSAHEAMRAVAPGLLDEIAEIRKQFPKARLTHFKAGDLEYGTPTPAGIPISEDLVLAVENKRRKALGLNKTAKRLGVRK